MRHKILIFILLLSLGSAGLVQALTGTIFADVNPTMGCEGIYFDVRAEHLSVLITGFEAAMVGTANVRVYYKPGTHAGSENNAGAWTLLGSQTVTAGSGAVSLTLYPVNVGGIVVPAGQTYGFLIYTGGTPGSLDLGTHYGSGILNISNGDVTLHGNAASCFGDPFTPFDGFSTNRAWRGKVHYTTDLSASLTDGRINRRDPAAAFAVYPHPDASGGLGLIFYDTYADRELLEVTAAQIAAVPEFPAENTLIAASPDGRVSLYRLFDGQFQAMGPAANGKQYGVIFPVISAGIDYRSFEE